MKYEDRVGLKDDPGIDREKAAWWREMETRADGNGPDPRCDRQDFAPYARP